MYFRVHFGANCNNNLSGANVSGANVSGANLSGANLSGANLSGANVELIDCRSILLCSRPVRAWGNHVDYHQWLCSTTTATHAVHMDPACAPAQLMMRAGPARPGAVGGLHRFA
jgi:hypothetical protein